MTFRLWFMFVGIWVTFALIGAFLNAESSDSAFNDDYRELLSLRELRDEDVDTDGAGSGVNVGFGVPGVGTIKAIWTAATFQSDLWQGDLQIIQFTFFLVFGAAFTLTFGGQVLSGVLGLLGRR